MAEQVHVNQQNLAKFQKWLLERQTANFDANKNLYFDLPLDVILKNAPDLSPAAQEILAYVIARGHGSKELLRDANTMLNLAEKFPILLGRTYFRSGNTRARGSSSIYSAILSVMANRPFEQNIPAIYTLLPYGYIIVSDIGTGEISKTSKKNASYLNKIFAMSTGSTFDNQANANAKDLIQHMDMSKLLNFDGASPEFRQRINAALFNQYSNQKISELLNQIDERLIDEQILSQILQGGIIARPKTVDTTNAKKQAEKNANILPTYYTKTRDMLIRLVERTEKHDPNNYGREKTLSQRFKEIMPRLMNVKTWQLVDIKNNEFIKDTYLNLLQRDIIAGRADQLSSEELQMVLQADKHNFYIRHIPEKTLKESKIQLNRKQSLLVNSDNAQLTEALVKEPGLSTHAKKAGIEKLKRSIEAEAPIRKKLNADLAQYDTDYAKLNEAGQLFQNAEALYTDMQHIQQAFLQITQRLKDGLPNEQEAHLAPAEIEKTIYDYITGASDKKVATPEQKNLPMIFGRGAEKERREFLASAIRKFNSILTEVRSKMNDEKRSMWANYKNAILSSKSLEKAAGIRNGAHIAAEGAHTEFKRIHYTRSRRDIETDQQMYESKKETLDRTVAEVERQQKNMRNLSRKHLGRNQAGELIAITPDMTPEEKRATRQKNKALLQDKLANRKKKPARNLQEMLANADMDR